jgi:hypothetical protein
MRKPRMTKSEKTFYRITLSKILAGDKPSESALRLWGFLQANKTF